MSDDDRTIVITGLGLVTPLGIGRERTWHAILAGRSGLRWRMRTTEASAGEAGTVSWPAAGVTACPTVGGEQAAGDGSQLARRGPCQLQAATVAAPVREPGGAFAGPPRRSAMALRLPPDWQRTGFAAGGPLPSLEGALTRIAAALRQRTLPARQAIAAERPRSVSESPFPGESPFGVWHELLVGDHPDRTVQAAVVAASEAISDAGLPWDLSMLGERCGLILGTSKGGIARLETLLSAARPSDGRPEALRASPDHVFDSGHWWQEVWRSVGPHTAAECVAQTYGIEGPRHVPVAACATGLLAVAQAAQWLRGGLCDVVVCGSADASLCDAVLASFQRLGVLSSGFEHPARAVRPFDFERSGFLVGEGAAVLVMERLSTARRRDCRPYARWLGEGWGTDPSGLTSMETTGATLSRVVQDVLDRAGISPDRVDLVSYHGTATAINDVCETQAIKKALGEHARKTPGFSLKPAVGHLLGAAGSVELAATLLALRDHIVPPTLNLRVRDPRCDLDYTPQHARPCFAKTAIKLSLGFGGHLAVAAVGAWD